MNQSIDGEPGQLAREKLGYVGLIDIKATIWENTSEKGSFFATTFSRPFKDQSGIWRNGTSFGLNDLEALPR